MILLSRPSNVISELLSHEVGTGLLNANCSKWFHFWGAKRLKLRIQMRYRYFFLIHSLIKCKACVNCSVMSNSDCSPPGSSVHRILQARILEWVAISFSKGSSPPRDQICISCTGTWILYHWATWEVYLPDTKPHIIASHLTLDTLISSERTSGTCLGEYLQADETCCATWITGRQTVHG